MAKNPNWTRDQLILAFNLYCKIGFTKIKYTRPDIIELAGLIGRSPSAVAYKLVNFARLDPALQKKGTKGMSHGSKAEEPVWNEFHNDWDTLAYESEKILANYSGKPIEEIAQIETYDLPKEGKEREALVKIRVNQSFFRKTVLASYQYTCCVTGITNPQLLVASHIIPWAKSAENRMKPENGLCLNALHDRAFDKGLITLSDEMRVILSPVLLKEKTSESIKQYFLPYHGNEIIKPNRFFPLQSFLEYHRKEVFQN